MSTAQEQPRKEVFFERTMAAVVGILMTTIGCFFQVNILSSDRPRIMQVITGVIFLPGLFSAMLLGSLFPVGFPGVWLIVVAAFLNCVYYSALAYSVMRITSSDD